MQQNSKNGYFIAAIVLGVLSITSTVYINSKIAKVYLAADGKTQALFGIVEVGRFGYQYYVLLLALAGLSMVLVGYNRNAPKKLFVSALIIGFIAMVIVFVRLWRFFI